MSSLGGPPVQPGAGSGESVMSNDVDGRDSSPACPNCGSPVAPSASFCEACGQTLTPIAPDNSQPPDEVLESPITLSRPIPLSALETDPPYGFDDTVVVARPCTNCGGRIGMDGYCDTCGTKAVSERDHYTENPASWVAACCDKGVRHYRNEDATAVAADTDGGGRAVLVVCDGVSTSIDSDVASLAAARAARDVLVANKPAGIGGVPASRAAAIANALEAAAAGANAAVIDNTASDSDSAASCTFSAAVVEADLVVFGNVGDSRVYWIPDKGSQEQPQQLSVDDSVAQARIAMGVPREEAENGPQAHAITKWLGRDAPDFAPTTGSLEAVRPGWVVVCSDGLWNYVSEAEDLQTLITDLSAHDSDPLFVSVALVDWANDQGGKDNISVALARLA